MPEGAIPKDLYAENALIGAVLIMACQPGWVLPDCCRDLKPGDFYQADASQAWSHILRHVRAGEPTDAVLIIGDGVRPSYLTKCLATVPTDLHVEWYARRVRATAAQRRAIREGVQQVQDAYEGKTKPAARHTGGVQV